MASYDEYRQAAINKSELEALQREAGNWHSYKWIRNCTIGVVLFLILCIGGCAGLKPKYDLYKAETKKNVLLKESRVKADAAQYDASRQVEIATAQAEAARIKAQGVADANETIAKTLTPEYIQWLYVDQLDSIGAGAKVIYLPQAFTPQMVANVGAGE